MKSKKLAIIAIVVVTIAIPVVIYTVSQLFVNTTINEPIPAEGSGK